MSHTPHELTEEFPEATDKIHELKTSNAHFAKLADEYHELNREIHRMETDVEPASDEHQTELRKKRMALKDEIYAMLKA
ncbi:MAG: YdcH family protein [Hyphomonas sp.]|uniref:YdcH family protein n=1 Tax=Hyphomonas sp. TaxID=87 RepID=UPI003526E582